MTRKGCLAWMIAYLAVGIVFASSVAVAWWSERSLPSLVVSWIMAVAFWPFLLLMSLLWTLAPSGH